MPRTVIPIFARRLPSGERRETPAGPQGGLAGGVGWTREEERSWKSMAQSTGQSPFGMRWVVVSLMVHAALYGLSFVVKKPLHVDFAPSGKQTRVTIVSGSDQATRERGEPEPQPYPNKPVDAPIITGPSTSAGGAPATKTLPAQPPSPTVLSRPRAADNSATNKTAPLVPEPSSAPEQDNPQQSSAPSVGFSPNLRDLLPNSRSEYVASQRRIGTIYGKGAVGGDIDPDSESREPVGYRAPRKGEVKVTRYDYAAYFLALDQRFSEAWGGTRVLPPGSNFYGVVGEVIEYDIVINRNGSLSKIINVSKKSQPTRNYADVDQLVNQVFANVFPLSPVPRRIQEDPLILRKRIRFTGYQYHMF
jgi:hypothetical protein